jgi:hypothetical protein
MFCGSVPVVLCRMTTKSNDIRRVLACFTADVIRCHHTTQADACFFNTRNAFIISYVTG